MTATATPGQVIERYTNAVRACTACPARQEASTNPIPCQVPLAAVDGGSRVRALIVAPAPVSSNWGSAAYSGLPRKVLDEFFLHAGLTAEHDVALTYLVHCPVHNGTNLTDAFATACQRFLRAEVALLRPKALVTLGRHVTRIITGHAKLADAIVADPHRFDGVPVVPAPAPVSTVLNEKARQVLFRQAALVSRLTEA